MAELLADERVYSELSLVRPLLPRELRRQHLAVHAVMGAAFQKTNNLQVLAGGSHVVMVAGGGVSIMSKSRPANGHPLSLIDASLRRSSDLAHVCSKRTPMV